MGIPSAVYFGIELLITDCSLHPDMEIHLCGLQEGSDRIILEERILIF